MEKPRHDGSCSCVTRVYDSSLSTLRLVLARQHFFFILMYTQLHDTVQYFMEFLNDFGRRGWLGCVCNMYNGIYYTTYISIIYIYIIVILLYEVSLNALFPTVTHHSFPLPFVFVSPENENTVEIRIRFILYPTKVKRSF